MSILILARQTDSDKKYNVGIIHKHYEMNSWLQAHGRKELIYELHKDTSIHSVWLWKEKTERWGRTATPSTKITSSPSNSDVSVNKKKVRQDKAKENVNNGRQPRS